VVEPSSAWLLDFERTRIVMKRLAILVVAAALPVVVFSLTAQGCADPCEDLLELCDRCGDDDYKKSCREVAALDNVAMCSAERSTFALYCTLDPNAADAGTSDAAGNCTNGATKCQGTCVNLNANANFCGSCTTKCAASEPCAAGECADAGCPQTLPDKNDAGGCYDKNSDPNNCGDAGDQCTDGGVCNEGKCADSCNADAGLTNCNGGCVDLATDTLNCGTCDTPCSSSQICSNGACASDCDTGLTKCCGKCVDTTADPENCGGCKPSCPEVADAGSDAGPSDAGADADAADAGEQCPPGEYQACDAGELCAPCGCASDCGDGGLTQCGQGCVDTNTNAQHCGSCFNLCVSGQLCSSGACAGSECPTGETQCGSSCVNLDDDPSNCGACGTTCNSMQACDNATCVSAGTCTDSKKDCSGSCVDIQSDPNHCGKCANKCGSDAGTPVCSKGTCKASCDSGLTNCNNACVKTDDAFSHCGKCGNSCNDESVCTYDTCSSGKCSNDSGGILCQGKNPCKTYECDPKKGCTSKNMSAGAILAGCKLSGDPEPPSGWNDQDLDGGGTYCLYCDQTNGDEDDKPCTYAVRGCYTCDSDRLEPPDAGPLLDAACAPAP